MWELSAQTWFFLNLKNMGHSSTLKKQPNNYLIKQIIFTQSGPTIHTKAFYNKHFNKASSNKK